MKKNILLFCFSSFITFKSFSQCEVKSMKMDEKFVRYTMDEEFSRNVDLENGMKVVYIFANAFKEAREKTTLLNTLVVTYVYSS